MNIPDAPNGSNTNALSFGLSLHGHHQLNSPEMSLKRQLEAALRPVLALGADEPQFVLPTGDLHLLVTPESALRTLQQCNSGTPGPINSIYAGTIFSGDKQRLKLFAILTLIGRPDAVYKFMNLGISDENLPLEPSLCEDYATESTIFRSQTPPSCFDLSQAGLNWREAAAFNHVQWKVLAPGFELLDGDSTPRSFHPNTILPFIWDGPAEPVIKTGGTSKVYQVQILPGHHTFNEFEDHNKLFAVKQLSSDDDDAFNREVEALKRFANDPDAHIVRLLTAFKVGSASYLVFPWADTDLHSFFNKHDGPKDNHAILTVEQMLGVAEALKAIHYCRAKKRAVKADQPEIEPVADVVEEGYHADLKPENILVADGQWKLADFGLSRFRRQDESGEDKPLGCSPTYRAPEHDVGSFDGQKADIWSLGCVMSVAATWMTLGRKGVHDFRAKRAVLGRASAEKERRVDDSFFEVSRKQGGKAEPNLKPAVAHWINKVRRAPTAVPVVHDLLDLLKEDLLVPEGTKRITSEQLVAKLQTIHRKCLDDPSYSLPDPHPIDSGISRPPTHPRDALEHCRSISVNTARLSNPWIGSLSQDSYVPDPGTSGYFTPTDSLMPFNFTEPLYRSQPLALSQNMGGQFSMGMQQANAAATEPMYVPPETLAAPTNRGKRKYSGPSAGPVPSKRYKPRQTLQPPQPPQPPQQRQQRQQHQQRQPDPVVTLSPATLRGTSEARETASPKSCAETEDLFPCPFFKHDPVKYSTKDWNLCGGAGWKIPRLKEHIRRNHHIEKYRCPRCRSKWSTAEELTEHQRSNDECSNNDEEDDDKVDLAQLNRIKDRMRGVKDSLKWEKIYHIIFPSDLIPSPYRHGTTIDEFRNHLNSLVVHPMNVQDKTRIQDCLELVNDFLKLGSSSQSSTESNVPALTLSKSACNTTIFELPVAPGKPSPSPDSNTNAFASDKSFWNPDKNGTMSFGDFQLYTDCNAFSQINAFDDGCPPPPYVVQQPNAAQQSNAVTPGTFQMMSLPESSPGPSFDHLNMSWPDMP